MAEIASMMEKVWTEMGLDFVNKIQTPPSMFHIQACIKVMLIYE